jgi:hypothetical protein
VLAAIMAAAVTGPKKVLNRARFFQRLTDSVRLDDLEDTWAAFRDHGWLQHAACRRAWA